MRESGYYPPGAEHDPSAPYNEIPVPERDFEVSISQSLSRSTVITTNDYQPEYDDEDGNIYANTENTDWTKAYINCAYTPMEIIKACKEIATHLRDKQGHFRYLDYHLKTLIESCEGWIEDETVVQEE